MKSVNLQALLSRAMQAFTAGRLDEADSLFAGITESFPQCVEAPFYRSVLAQNKGELDLAAALLARVLKIKPQLVEAHNNLGAIRQAQGQVEEALSCYRRALKANPNRIDSLANLGSLLIEQSRLEEAIPCYRRLIALQPDDAGNHDNLGHCLNMLGRLEEASACFARSIALNPQSSRAHFNHGVCQERLGRGEGAVASYRRAQDLDKNNVQAYYKLGRLLQNLKRHEEAIVCWRSLLSLDPDEVEALCHLGNSCAALERYEEAELCYRGVLSVNASDALVYYNLGNVLLAKQAFDEALACYRQALSLRPDYIDAFINLAHNLRAMNRYDESVAVYRQALSIGSHPAIVQNLAFMQLYRPHRGEEVLAGHRRFDTLFAQPAAAEIRRHGNDPDPQRKLKIGYVSADFCSHSVAGFIEPILEVHDRARFEISCYYNHERKDEVTGRIAASADRFISCAGMSDDELAERIRADGIDILVDLSGHTQGNRLPVFARRPAPLQVTYLGYPASTGLAAMDYRITHADVDPDGNEAYHSEALLRLDGSLWCYRPRHDAPEVAPLPALEQGFVTFASLNYFLKLTDQAIALWSGILRSLPDSRLIVSSVPKGAATERLYAQFAGHGIVAERLAIHDKLAEAEFRELFSRIDIALDPFPYNGTTTSCDCLWQGIPFVTLAGQTSVARSGYALLKSVGLPELIAHSEDEYLAIAQSLAANLPSLAALRQNLRPTMASSPLMDSARCTRAIETAFREIWRTWCRNESPTHVQFGLSGASISPKG